MEVRRATADDLPALVQLLRRRDNRNHPAEAVAKYLLDVDPERIIAWLAIVDGLPAALNTIYFRQLGWGDQSIRAGYWAHLYVDPEHRKLMIYPQLVASMLRAARELPLDVIYTATRRQQVADSHVKLGFRLLATITVQMKPLRPARMLARHWQWPQPFEILSVPLDVIWGWRQQRRFRTSQGDAALEVMPWNSVEIGEVVDFANATAGNRIHMQWDEALFLRRFANTIEGNPYTLLVVRHTSDRSLIAASLMRIAERGTPAIRAAVLMDLVTSPSHQHLAPLLLQEMDNFAHSNDADVILALDGAGSEFSDQLKNWGYRVAPETYNLLVWPKTKVTPDTFAGQIQNWRFTFADHDAF